MRTDPGRFFQKEQRAQSSAESIGRTGTLVGLMEIPGTVQILPKGFANSPHYHPAAEGFWMVLSGEVRFYGNDSNFLGEFGPMEGVLIPRNGRYWFAQAGEEEAHLLQVRGDANDGSKSRVDVGEVHANYGKKRIHRLADTTAPTATEEIKTFFNIEFSLLDFRAALMEAGPPLTYPALKPIPGRREEVPAFLLRPAR